MKLHTGNWKQGNCLWIFKKDVDRWLVQDLSSFGYHCVLNSSATWKFLKYQSLHFNPVFVFYFRVQRLAHKYKCQLNADLRSSSSIFLFGLCFIFCLKKSNRTWKKLNNKPPHFTPTRRGLLILQPPTCVSGIEQVFKLPFLRYFSYHQKKH